MKKQTWNKDKAFAIALIIAFLLLFLCPRSLWAQRNTGFFGGSITSFGVGLDIGYEGKIMGIESVALAAGWSHSVFNPSINPDVYYLTGGYVYRFHNDKAYSISLHGGYAYTTRKIVVDHDYFGQDKKRTIIVNFEAGKDIADGRIYFNAGYVNKPYLGIGFRGYF